MKTIIFRPIRIVKKTGKIVVASYSQWYSVKNADRDKLNLVIDPTYRELREDAPVYNHNGENLFWRDYDPEEIPIFDSPLPMTWDEIKEIYPRFAIRYHPVLNPSFCAQGLDCDGTPTFSHGTIKHISNGYRDMSGFDLLTVGIVSKWFGWWLMNLRNATITAKPSRE